MPYKIFIINLFFIISFTSLAGKPTDEKVLLDISRANMQDIQLNKGEGSFSVYNLQRWWTRGVTYKINAGLKEFPQAKIKVGAEARYRIIGENYDFDKLKTVWNEYQGIETPSDEIILSLLRKNIISFVQPYNWNQMVSELDGPTLSKDPVIRNVKWHNANSFTIHVQAKYSVITSYTEVQDKLTNFAVRFYRDSIKEPWKQNFYSSVKTEEVLATHKYTTNEINAMPTQPSLLAEKQSRADSGAASSLVVPQKNTATVKSLSTTIKPLQKSWNWTKYTSQYLPVSMKIIGSATEKQETSNGNLTTTMVSKTAQGNFRMTATDYRQIISPEVATATHLQFANNFVKSNNALIHKKKVSTFATGDALDYLIERGSGKQRMMIRYKIFSSGTVVYQVMYSQLKTTFNKTVSNEFIASIQLK